MMSAIHGPEQVAVLGGEEKGAKETKTYGISEGGVEAFVCFA